MNDTKLTDRALAQFIGSEIWHRHGINRNVLYTEGAKFVGDICGAYWLLDPIAIMQGDGRLKAQEFQVWKLKVHQDRSAALVCEDGNGGAVYTVNIPFTDFPMRALTL